MKILQINNVYDFGSTGKITRDIHHGLLEYGYESVVYYGRRYRTKDKNVHKICSEFYGKAQNGFYQITGIKYGGCVISTQRLISAIRKEKPDVVHLQCLNGHFVNIYRLLAFLKAREIPTVLTLHAEFMYTGGCSHSLDCNQWRTAAGCGHSGCPQYKKELKSRSGDQSSAMWIRMKRAFSGFDHLVVVSVSPWLMERARVSEILKGKDHRLIYNGLDTDIFHAYSADELSNIRNELGYEPEDKIVFHASPYFDNRPDHIKGGYYIIKLAERLKDIHFLIAGKYDPSLTVPDNVKLLGNVTDKARMAMLYSMSDVTLLTSKKETFSMVCAESLCCGTPVVGFKAGAPELISLPAYSGFCDYADLNALEKLVSDWINKGKSPGISEDSIKVYRKERMISAYMDIYQSLIHH